MDMYLNEEQKLISDTAKSFFEKKYKSEVMREVIEKQNAFSSDLWKQIIDLGWLGIRVPEEYDGMDMELLDFVLLSEEIGKAGFLSPFFVNHLACQIILEAGTEEQKKELVPKVLSGELILTLAYAEHTPRFDPYYVSMKVTEEDSGYRLNGVKQFVEYADIADYAICVGRTNEDVYSKDGISFFLVDMKADGIVKTKLETLARDNQYKVELKDVFVSKEQLLGEKDQGSRYIDSAFNQARLIKYADLLGRLERVLDMAVEYSKERIQNGRPIGSYQALQHQFANSATEIDGAKYLMYRAAASANSEGKVSNKDILTTCAWIERIYLPTIWYLTETLGAIGVTEEYDLHYYIRYAKAHHPLFGDEDFYKEALKKVLW